MKRLLMSPVLLLLLAALDLTLVVYWIATDAPLMAGVCGIALGLVLGALQVVWPRW